MLLPRAASCRQVADLPVLGTAKTQFWLQECFGWVIASSAQCAAAVSFVCFTTDASCIMMLFV